MTSLRLFCLDCHRWLAEDSRELQIGAGDNTSSTITWYRCKHCGGDHVHHEQHPDVRRISRLRCASQVQEGWQ